MSTISKHIHISQMSEIDLRKWRHKEFLGLKDCQRKLPPFNTFWSRTQPMPLEPLGTLMVEPKYRLPEYSPDYVTPYHGHYDVAANAVFNVARRFNVEVATTFYEARIGSLVFLWSQRSLITKAFIHMDHEYAEAFNKRSWWKSLMDGTYPTHGEMRTAFEALDSIFQNWKA